MGFGLLFKYFLMQSYEDVLHEMAFAKASFSTCRCCARAALGMTDLSRSMQGLKPVLLVAA
jgi:hypothetical protein